VLQRDVSAEKVADNEHRPLHVLLCPDQPSWAFDNIADNIAKFAGHNRVSKIYMADVIGNEHLIFETIFLKRIDLCHIFWREDLFHLFNPATINKVARHLALDHETITRAINSCTFTTSIYDHLFCETGNMQARRAGFALTDGYTVSSQKLYSIYASQTDLPAPDSVISDGVDTEHFIPGETKLENDNSFTIGWVGNSAWGKQSTGYDIKGYQRLFVPMINELSARGLAVATKVADPQIKRIAFQDMPNFYRQLDVFVCTSAMEGTPNPVLEAMACGIPVVSTDVGIVPEAFGPLQRNFIVAAPDTASFSDAVAQILGDPELARALGTENRQQAMQWSWQHKSQEWWPFWQSVVRRATEPRNALRREFCIRSLAACEALMGN